MHSSRKDSAGAKRDSVWHCRSHRCRARPSRLRARFAVTRLSKPPSQVLSSFTTSFPTRLHVSTPDAKCLATWRPRERTARTHILQEARCAFRCRRFAEELRKPDAAARYPTNHRGGCCVSGSLRRRFGVSGTRTAVAFVSSLRLAAPVLGRCASPAAARIRHRRACARCRVMASQAGTVGSRTQPDASLIAF